MPDANSPPARRLMDVEDLFRYAPLVQRLKSQATEREAHQRRLARVIPD